MLFYQCRLQVFGLRTVFLSAVLAVKLFIICLTLLIGLRCTHRFQCAVSYSAVMDIRQTSVEVHAWFLCALFLHDSLSFIRSGPAWANPVKYQDLIKPSM